jgi:DNA-binding LacI/PurR family transcriptional regulator
VNPSTISRALNAATRHLIGDEVVRRVMASAKALGYRQNKLAAALRGGQSRVIGVCLPDIENPVFPPIVRGIEEEMSAAGYGVLIANVAGTIKEQERMLEQMLERRVDGLILATAARQDPLVRRTLLQRMPVVLVNRSLEGGEVAEVVNDDLLSLQLAVDHLVALGHEHIAHLAGPSRLATGHARVLGFEIAMKRHDVNPNVVPEATEFTREAGRLACEQLIARHKSVTAIIAGNDLIDQLPRGHVADRPQRYAAARHAAPAAYHGTYPTPRNGTPRGAPVVERDQCAEFASVAHHATASINSTRFDRCTTQGKIRGATPHDDTVGASTSSQDGRAPTFAASHGCPRMQIVGRSNKGDLSRPVFTW